MIQNIEARTAIVARIEAAKAPSDPFKVRVGQLLKTTSARANWLAKGEKAVGIVGGRANMAVFSPAGAREAGSVDRILFYGPTAALVHEEVATEEALAWFEAQFVRKA